MKRINASASAILIALLTSFPAVAGDNAVTKEKCIEGDKFQKAAAKSDTKCIQACLKAGTPVDSAEGNGWTALHAAAFSGQEEAVKLLLESGADATLKDKNGKTPLDLANAKKHLAVAKILSTPADTETVSDSMVEKLAEALRWELNNYGPASSSDDIDYQVVEVLKAEKSESAAGTSYTITVKFNTGSSQDEADMITYKGIISESAGGDLSVTEYKSED